MSSFSGGMFLATAQNQVRLRWDLQQVWWFIRHHLPPLRRWRWWNAHRSSRAIRPFDLRRRTLPLQPHRPAGRPMTATRSASMENPRTGLSAGRPLSSPINTGLLRCRPIARRKPQNLSSRS